MEFNFDLFVDILWLGTVCSVVSAVCMQKIKEMKIFTNSKWISFISIIINICTGFIISRLFTNLKPLFCLEVGLISWIGAEKIYEKLKERKSMKNNKEVQLNLKEEDFRKKKKRK